MGSTSSGDREFGVEAIAGSDPLRLRIEGALTIESSEALWRELRSKLGNVGTQAELDLAGVETCDGSGAALLLALRARAREAGAELELTGANAQVASLLALYGCPTDSPPLRDLDRKVGLLAKVGESSFAIIAIVKQSLAFLGEFAIALRGAIRRPSSVNWREIVQLCERTGADAVPIVLMVNFLIGAIMGLQAADQLERFGASIFVADLVGLSIVRELGPLMTAIIVAGRTGAAFAAELGTMRVSEEVDALETLGLDPQRFLVFPRLIALVLVMPLLVLLADFVGCLGGLFVALMSLDLTMVAYTTELGQALDLWDVGGGLVKGIVFAAVITLIACQKGLGTRGGAEGVGISTTSAVVSILFSLVALDAVFTIVFNLFGI